MYIGHSRDVSYRNLSLAPSYEEIPAKVLRAPIKNYGKGAGSHAVASTYRKIYGIFFFFFFTMYQSPCEKGSTLKGKILLPYFRKTYFTFLWKTYFRKGSKTLLT